MAIVLDPVQTRPLGLDAHVDVFGDQANHPIRLLGLQFQGDVDNPVVIRLVLGGIEERHDAVFLNQLIRIDGKGPQGAGGI